MIKFVLTPAIALLISFSISAQETEYSKDELLGKFEPSEHESFEKIPEKFTTKSNIYLRKEALAAFEEMYEAAKADSIDLSIISATRNYDYQRGIWLRKWKNLDNSKMSDREKVSDIMTYSSMPGTSRHHWGTDIDLNDLNNSYFEKGEGKKVYQWLLDNASEYGFYQAYTNQKNGRPGYAEEKWHWSYEPIAAPMRRQYNEKVSYSDLGGFAGSEQAKDVKAIEFYVNGVNGKLR